MTRNLRTQLANAAERWMRAWAGDDLARESAEVLYTYWDLADPADDELRAEVLSRFPAAEPPAVPGLDFLAVEQDAKTIVAETLAEPKPECWCGKTLLANGFCPDYIHGPAKVEVTPDVATAVWDDSVPPGGFVCSVCRTPVESEPCPVHGAECAS